MGILADYLKVLPEGIKNWKDIAQSLKTEIKSRLGDLDEDELEEITKRRLICEECPFNSKNAKESKTIAYDSKRLDDHCIMCGCNLHLKTECLDCNCGIEVFNKHNPKQTMDLKWTIYNKKEDGNE
jgi:hypothetical protein